MQAIAAVLPCASASQLGYGYGHFKEVVARRRKVTPTVGFNMGRGGRIVVRSQRPDVEQKEELSGFDMPKRVGIQKVETIERGDDDDGGQRVERMFSNLNEVSLKHEPGKFPHSLDYLQFLISYNPHFFLTSKGMCNISSGYSVAEKED